MSERSKNSEFPKILLNTIFTFMVCDGDISPDELEYIKKMTVNQSLFEDMDVDKELQEMVRLVNLKGVDYLGDYFKKVKHADLSEEDELLMLEFALETIKSDNQIKMDEVNFLKILRTMLKSSDEKILTRFPEMAKDFVKKDDLTNAYIKEIYENYFNQKELPKFDIDDVQDITDNVNLGKGAKQ